AGRLDGGARTFSHRHAAPVPPVPPGATTGSFCAACGAATPAGARFCPGCGRALGAAACGRCHAPLPAGARFCPQCGAPTGA
ncbi:MAG: zinc ribbon domain-containing protein, partial [Candidatus Polarisedimenticolia bacterium]